jgi:hypothetical protein
MLTELEYVEQQRQLGRRIHQHDGIFWEQTYPFYCRPAFIYRAFDRGTAKPHALKSLLGYSHQIIDSNKATDYKTFMEIDREELNGYSIEKLHPKKRNKVRQSLKFCEVKLITHMDEELMGRIRQINIEQSIRQEKGFGAETPVDRYIKEKEQWIKQIKKDFALNGREWWGAYYEGILTAYMRTYQVDGIRVIEQTKLDSKYIDYKPMDGLYFSVINMAAKDLSCEKIMNGTPLHPSLNLFKEQFLFKQVTYPYFTSNYKLNQGIRKLLKKQ